MKWYVINTYSGFEDRVKSNIETRVQALGLEELFGRIVIPTEEVTEIRGGRKKTQRKRFFPGYVLIEMEMNESSWDAVRATPKVTSFVTGGGEPIPLEDQDVRMILGKTRTKRTRPKPKVIYDKGDRVKVLEGPFTNFSGQIEEIDAEKGRLKVLISIFGRSTPVELEFHHVEREG